MPLWKLEATRPQTQIAIGSPVLSSGMTSGRLRPLPPTRRSADQQATVASRMSSIGSPWLRPSFSCDQVQFGERPCEGALPLFASQERRLAMNYRCANQHGEGHFGVNFPHHLAQFRARLQKSINFPDLWQKGECLLGDHLAGGCAGP